MWQSRRVADATSQVACRGEAKPEGSCKLHRTRLQAEWRQSFQGA